MESLKDIERTIIYIYRYDIYKIITKYALDIEFELL